ncbi:molybdopterin-dependent oxidoreductase [Runella sp.]|uniref:molybdopterin-dependent oxidoreductase n=1 Tax=Runella sp. TaxID=1960881 RepID=UPI003D0F871D
MKKVLIIVLLTTFNVIAQKKEPQKLKVSGAVENSMALSIDDLKTKKVVSGKAFKIVSLEGQVKKTIAAFRGVALKSLLDEAKILITNPKEKGQFYVSVVGNDGQKVIFSWSELYNGTTGDKALILFEDNGRPIAKDGPFSLITTADIFTETRYVRSVKSIEVGKIQ